MPWTKRANAEKKRREDAELRCAQVKEDWVQIRRHQESIDREIQINDWTNTAIALFLEGEKGDYTYCV